ncbi:phytoene dehydrogenase family protein [Patulibacter medicamentivorans]|uniref:Phytoene dehydrogenase family protein n=1 Tax=Patulibacter medicamentivorans TaxID=1097667 RepID=H0E5L1_9ACTN|nr:NAD(P)/FAD-dependent oxidoreductase [Patulibacter medicamentivorans]EHN11046.1 phytoene dehydrogenase family protein [Patulibacter medicamentivorans]
MNSAPDHYDVLVIGAGMGGVCAAARLAHAGQRPLLVERLDRVGGRASTFDVDGFKVNTGAVAIEYGGTMEQTFVDLGIGERFALRDPQPANLFQVKGKTVNPAKGGWKFLIDQMTKKGAGVLQKLGGARKGELPEEQVTLAEWVGGATSNATVHRLFRNLSAAIFAVNADEIPAKAFLTYFTQKGAFKHFGFHPEGTIGVTRALSDAAVEAGGELWLRSEVTALQVEDGRVTGATISRAGEAVQVTVGAVISNVGPVATIDLVGEQALGAEYVARIRERSNPSANIIIHVASREPLIDAPGLLLCSDTDRVCNLGNMTATCPELAPEGWHLTVAYAVPIPAVGDFDAERELELSLQELRDTFPVMNDPETRVIDVRVMRGDWPAQRAVSGYELPRETPLDNLFNVGDGVRDYGSGGTQSCAETAKAVVDELLGGVPAPIPS